MQDNTLDKPARKGGNGPFWALLVVTGLPFIAALTMIYNPDLIDLNTGNRGQLVQPTRTVQPMHLETLDGGVLDTATLKDHWTLVMVGDTRCEAACQKNLFHLRQIRLAVGEDRYRVQRVMVLSDEGDSTTLRGVLESFAGTQVVTGPESERARLLELLRVDDQPLDGRVYTIDPQGELILAYDANPPWKDVLKDLQQLLKVVQL